MGFWSKFFGQSKDLGNVSVGTSSIGELVRQAESPSRGTQELFTAYKNSPWLQSVTRKIAEHIASVPWELYVMRRSVAGGKSKAFRCSQIQSASFKYRQKLLADYKRVGTERVEVFEHPFLDLLNKPNSQMTGLQGRMVTSLFMDLKGEAFWYLVLNKQNKPMMAYPIPSHWVTRLPTAGNNTYEITLNGRRMTDVPIAQVIWQKYINPADPYGRGVGSGEALSDEIATDEYLAKTVMGTYYNRAMPELFISVQGVESDDQMQRIADQFKDRHRGPLRHFH